MAAETPTTLIYPIGHFRGPFYTDNVAVPDAYLVRVGATVASLPYLHFLTWSVSHGLIADPPPPPMTRDGLAERATEEGVADAPALISELVDAGLLHEVDLDGPAAEEFARRYRLSPLLLGLGNSGEDPLGFQIGLPGAPAVVVSPHIYNLWHSAPSTATLWDACEQMATENRALVAEVGPEGIAALFSEDPREILAGFLGSLHTLLASSAAYLDEVPTGVERV
jgi:hypothetical protein